MGVNLRVSLKNVKLKVAVFFLIRYLKVMKIQLIKDTLDFEDQETNALVFLPDPSKDLASTFAIFTHGYTSHKGSILNWSIRLAEEGVPSVIFDLPGHYLGNYSEVASFESFKERAPYLFLGAYHLLTSTIEHERPLSAHLCDSDAHTLVLGGHSLGSLLALKASELDAFEFHKLHLLAIGFGLPPEGVTHIFDTPFYKSTLAIREQLVSPAIAPDLIFPWIKHEKEVMKLPGKQIHFICGEDDMVVGSDGAERLAKSLADSGAQVTVQKPAKMPHHMPEMAAPHIKKHLKDLGLFS